MTRQSYTLGDIKALIPQSSCVGPNSAFVRLATDSRLLSGAHELCFFALRGERHDGHRFVGAAYTAGVRAFVVDRLPENPPDDAGFIVVPNVLDALQAIAAHHRTRFSLPVIAVTGSNGKTIVKEWLGQLLSADERIVRNPRSYNSQVGVPLSVWGIQAGDTLGIFEAGISEPGEMERLERIIQPNDGIFTHFGDAHRENFASDEDRAIEKCRLFKHCDTVYFCADEDPIAAALDATAFTGRRCTWSAQGREATLVLREKTLTDVGVHVQLRYEKADFELHFPFADSASFSNLMSCILVLCTRGVEPAVIQQRITPLRTPEMRLERSRGVYGSVIISDVWNNDLHALRLALQSLDGVKDVKRKAVILSDIPQSGVSDDILYKEVNALLKAHNIDVFIGVGTEIQKHRKSFDLMNVYTFSTTDELIFNLPQALLSNAVVLVKGAYAFRFDRVVRRLQWMAHPSVLEIDMSRVVANLNFYRSKLRAGTKVMAMVKAFGYGTGGSELAALLEFNRVDYLGVAYVHEGVALREAGIRTGIFVLNPDISALSTLVSNALEPEVYSERLLRALLGILRETNQRDYPIHLKIDTGMHRLGFYPEQLDALIALLKAHPEVRVRGVLSHLASADRHDHDAFTRTQIERFTAACERLETGLGYSFTRHLCNTAGLLRFPDAHFDMVRLGIGLYGVPSCAEDATAIHPSGTLKTRISQLRTVPAGDSVGYGLRGVANHDRVIATVPVGYADGYPRSLSNGNGVAILHGREVRVTGSVCMDMTMFDVTGVDCAEGDELQLFGDRPTLHEVATAAGTIPYELLAGISPRVFRVYRYE